MATPEDNFTPEQDGDEVQNLSDRLYDLSDELGGGVMAEKIESVARQASELELDIQNFVNAVEDFNSMDEWRIDTLPDFMNTMQIYVHKFSRNVKIEVSKEQE
jgi:hypothetical protein